MALGSSIWLKILDLIIASQLLFVVNHALQVAFSREKASIMSLWESELFSVALLKTIVSCVHTKTRAGRGEGRLDTKESLYIVGVFFFPLLEKISS